MHFTTGEALIKYLSMDQVNLTVRDRRTNEVLNDKWVAWPIEVRDLSFSWFSRKKDGARRRYRLLLVNHFTHSVIFQTSDIQPYPGEFLILPSETDTEVLYPGEYRVRVVVYPEGEIQNNVSIGETMFTVVKNPEEEESASLSSGEEGGSTSGGEGENASLSSGEEGEEYDSEE